MASEFIKLICVKTCNRKTMSEDHHFIAGEIYYLRGSWVYDKDKKIMIAFRWQKFYMYIEEYFKIMADYREERINEILND